MTAPTSPEITAYRQSVDDVAAALKTDRRLGLSESEARSRLKVYGRNELQTEPPVPALRKFLAQFSDMLVILLLVASAISGLLWLYERESALPYEAIAILAIVILNAVLGYVQQSRAEAAVAALRAMAADDATVIRDGKQTRIPSTEIVPRRTPAPRRRRYGSGRRAHSPIGRLANSRGRFDRRKFACVERYRAHCRRCLGDRRNMLFSGTTVTYGRGKAIVIATGMQTEMGRIAQMLHEAPAETTPLQKELDRVGKMLGAIVVVIAVLMIGTILSVDEIRGLTAFLDALILGVALAVAAVPEGLPAVVSVVLALGVQRMAKRNAIVRRLSAVETLGSATSLLRIKPAH